MIARMQATRLLVIRHGETDWNATQRIQGHTDIPLNAKGQEQALRLARTLAPRESIAALYSSDLSRARQTAQPLADATGAPLYEHVGLRERGFGDFEGARFEDITRTHPDAAEAWRRRVPDWAPPGGGESLTAMRARILAAVNDIAACHGGEQIALIAHGGVLDMCYRLATGQDLQAPRTWMLANTAVNRLLWTPETLTLVGWDDQQHLADDTEHPAIDERSF